MAPEVDLEKGIPLQLDTSPFASAGPYSIKTPEVTVTEISSKPKPSPRRRNSRKPSLTVNFDRSNSPVLSEKPIDPQRIITNCNCEGSKDLTILPFFLPTELGLSGFNKETKYWIIEPFTITPQTEFTLIDPEYIMLDKVIPKTDPRHGTTYIARPLLPLELNNIYKGGRKSSLSGSERWKILNYGSTNPRAPYIARLCENHTIEYPVIVSESLINDVKRWLYPNSLPEGLVNDAFIEWLRPTTRMQVYGLIYFCGSGVRGYFWELGWYFPLSYIVADYIAFAKFLRIPFPRTPKDVEKLGEKEKDGHQEDVLLSPTDGGHSERESEVSDNEGHNKAKELSWATQFRNFQLPRREFWKMQLKLEKFKIQTTQFEQAYKKASVRWQNYPLHIANIQSFNLKKSDISLPTLRFVRSLGMKPPTRHLSLVDIIRERCGLDENDKPAKLPEGSLGALTAHNIKSGAFKIGLTDNPGKHLTFEEEDGKEVLKVLSLKGVSSIFALQHADLCNIAGIPTLFLEHLNTLTLFFHSPPSRPTAQSLSIDLRILDSYTKTYSLSPLPLQYEHFPIYAARLKGVVDKMNEWRPVSYRELRIRPYNDVLSYHAFWFSCYLAGFTVLSLAIAFAQTYAQFTQGSGSPVSAPSKS